jgi:hypothetical protein
MKKSIFAFSAALLCFVLIQTSCTKQKGGGSFTNKADSIQFAKAVYALYPNEVATPPVLDTLTPPITEKQGVMPIPWDTVVAYKNYYAKNPQLYNPQKQPYQGFSIDPNGFDMIKSNDLIKGLYLCLGRRGNGAYTIMLLGTDENGNLINKGNTQGKLANPKDSTNFDHLDPCPNTCIVIE